MSQQNNVKLDLTLDGIEWNDEIDNVKHAHFQLGHR